MSLEATIAAWKRKLTPSEKLVLLAMADYASDEGVAFPSFASLAAKTGLSRATVCRMVRKLISCGELKRVESGGGRESTSYLLTCVIDPSHHEPPHSEPPHHETAAASPRDCTRLIDDGAIRKEQSFNSHITNNPTRAAISDFDCDLDFAAAELMHRLRMFGSDAHPLCRSSAKAYCDEFRLPPLRAPDEITALYARYMELGGTKEAVFFLKNGTFLKPEAQWGIHGTNQTSRHQAKAEQRAASWDRAFGIRRDLDS